MALVEYSPQVLEPKPHFVQSWLPWLRWVPSSAQQLEQSEDDILGHLENPGEGFYVKAGTVGGHEVRVWTKRWQGPTPSLSKPPFRDGARHGRWPCHVCSQHPRVEQAADGAC